MFRFNLLIFLCFQVDRKEALGRKGLKTSGMEAIMCMFYKWVKIMFRESILRVSALF